MKRRPHRQTIIGEIGVSPRNDDAVGEELGVVTAERWLRDELEAAGLHHRESPRRDLRRPFAFIGYAVLDPHSGTIRLRAK
jgi:hypothetical protein